MAYRHSPEIKARILAAGVELWPNASIRGIGRKVKMAHATVRYHFTDIAGLKDAIARYAVETGNSAIIVQLIGLNHPAVAALSDADKSKHLKGIRHA